MDKISLPTSETIAQVTGLLAFVGLIIKLVRSWITKEVEIVMAKDKEEMKKLIAENHQATNAKIDKLIENIILKND